MHHAIPALKKHFLVDSVSKDEQSSPGVSPIISKSADFSFHRYKKEIKMEMNMKSFAREAQ